MIQVINDSTFEHPCMSYIADLADPIWLNYLFPEENDEVRTYNSFNLPDLQDEIQNCIDLYDSSALKTAADYYEFASDLKLRFSDTFEKRWVKESIMNAAGLFEEDKLLYIEPSKTAKNEGRSLEFRERRERKVVGAKVDILFKKITDEVGYTEVGKHDVLVIDDKYLDDGMVKLPKTIRHMLCGLVKVNPHKINQLYTVSFLMMGLNLELLIMNVPAVRPSAGLLAPRSFLSRAS